MSGDPACSQRGGSAPGPSSAGRTDVAAPPESIRRRSLEYRAPMRTGRSNSSTNGASACGCAADREQEPSRCLRRRSTVRWSAPLRDDYVGQFASHQDRLVECGDRGPSYGNHGRRTSAPARCSATLRRHPDWIIRRAQPLRRDLRYRPRDRRQAHRPRRQPRGRRCRAAPHDVGKTARRAPQYGYRTLGVARWTWVMPTASWPALAIATAPASGPFFPCGLEHLVRVERQTSVSRSWA